MKVGKKNQLIHAHRINEKIRAIKVRLTSVDGEQIGILSLQDALKKAQELGVDLVEISPNAEPPVCRLMDYGKFLYEKNKATKKQKKKQKIISVKEVKFRPSTQEGDYQVKLRNLIRFLKEGHKVKITLRFRGREMAHQRIGLKILKRVQQDIKILAIIEFFPTKIEGRQMIMLLSPKKNIK
ncbi:translation initiation factor IF-3 [Buchnera aphidicola]|uniref:Translation initiation factor IF-3 n=1 Tax=Buchnera aphidicola subsp. Tuberolachnus salignus TaxID=98804 RepID=A0A160SVS5_BUCTT|nr:translation initiation factor IF-3 [Buchnera aphidicola]CUR53067.1 Translation initiation factor IF-3 [Buchnera aphidicola (Tuberolachnus salignus)]